MLRFSDYTIGTDYSAQTWSSGTYSTSGFDEIIAWCKYCNYKVHKSDLQQNISSRSYVARCRSCGQKTWYERDGSSFVDVSKEHWYMKSQPMVSGYPEPSSEDGKVYEEKKKVDEEEDGKLQELIAYFYSRK